MKKKTMVMGCIISLTTLHAFSQDTSGHKANSHNNSPDTSIAQSHKDTEYPPKPTQSPHTDVKVNRGTAIPATTSGTLNSTVNPNTQLIIPFHKARRKSHPAAKNDSLITPLKK